MICWTREGDRLFRSGNRAIGTNLRCQSIDKQNIHIDMYSHIHLLLFLMPISSIQKFTSNPIPTNTVMFYSQLQQRHVAFKPSTSIPLFPLPLDMTRHC